MVKVRTFLGPGDIAAEAARLAAESLKDTQQTYGLATFALAGGRLPPIANRLLADQYATTFNWEQVLFLIGDERCVPLDDAESSWLSALPLFEAHPEIPNNHKLRPHSQLSAEQAAHDYALVLQALPRKQSGIPTIDHLWLGIGEDGHTLSLFPNHPLDSGLDELVIPVHNAPKPPPDRISLSYKALSGVRSAVVFISGTSKAPIIAQIASGDHTLPIAVASKTIEKAGGVVTWLMDQAALSQISDKTDNQAASIARILFG